MIPKGIAPPEPRELPDQEPAARPPLATDQLAHERLGKPTALAVFASDNLSSSAYATEEILRVLVPAIGVAAFALVVPITVALLVVLALPDPLVPPDDQGVPDRRWRVHRHPRQLRAAPRPGRRRRAAHRLHPHRGGLGRGRHRGAELGVPGAGAVHGGDLDRCSSLLIAYGNLRGVRESGRLFATPDLLLHRQHGRPARRRAYKLAHRSPARGVAPPRRHGAGRRWRQRHLHGRHALHRAARVRLGRRRGHRRRGDLQRCARVPGAGVEERPRAPSSSWARRSASCSSACRSSPRTCTPLRTSSGTPTVISQIGKLVFGTGGVGTFCSTPSRPARC